MAGFVFSADWHLARLTWQHRPKIAGDAFFALEQIVDFCIQNDAELLAGGDLFDKDRPDSAAVVCMADQMSRMRTANLPVYYIQGQHEMADPPWLSSHSWPERLHKRGVNTEAGLIYGLDWCPREQFVAAMADIPKDARMLLCHQVWMEHMGSVVTCPEANVQDLPEQISVVMTGDYHQHQSTVHMTPTGEKLLLSNGAISMRNLAEPPHKAFWYYNYGKFNSVMLRGRPFVSQTIVDVNQIDALHAAAWAAGEGLPDYMRMPICVLKYSADIPDAHKRITEKFVDTALWLEECRSEIAPQEVDLPAWDDNCTVSLPGLIATSLPEGPDRTALLQLVESSATPGEAIRRWVFQNFPQLGDPNAARAANPAQLVPVPGAGNSV